MKSYNVAVYGAAGHTGQFVVSELERRGVAVRSITRGAPKESISRKDGGQLTAVSASCDEPEALDRALEGTDAVINCAGPFLDTAPAVIEAALRVGVHYLDIAAEQRSVRQSLATYNAWCYPRWRSMEGSRIYWWRSFVQGFELSTKFSSASPWTTGTPLRALGVRESAIRLAGSSCREGAWCHCLLPQHEVAGSFPCRLEISLWRAFLCRKSLRFPGTSRRVESRAS
jgi:hypothetical protein